MNVTLKMKMDDQDIDLVVDVTLKACRIYRQQFGRDLVKDLTDTYHKINPSIYDFVDLSEIKVDGKEETELQQEIIAKAFPAYKKYQNTNVFTYDDTEQATQIIWAFAKNADEKLPKYEDWIDDFDFILPVKNIITSLYKVWNDSARPTIEIKN